MAPDSNIVNVPSVIAGTLPTGFSARYSGLARYGDANSIVFTSCGMSSSWHSQITRIERVPGALDAERAEAALRALLAVEVEDEAALAAVLAGVCAEVMVVEGPIEPAEAGRLLAALGRVEHAPPRSWPVAFVLTEAELRRKLVGR